MQASDQRNPLLSPTSNVESASLAPSQVNVLGLFNGGPRQNGMECVSEDLSSSFDEPDQQQSQNGSPSSRRKKLHQLASRTKDATKRLLNTSDRHGRSQDLPQEDDHSLHLLKNDAAFNLNKLDTEHRSDKGIAAKIQVNLQAVAAGIANPKKGIKGKVARSTAGRLSKIERPYLSKDMDMDLLDAHDNLSRAQSAFSSRHASEDDPDLCTDECNERIERLETQRESLRAAYTTSRLVQRVRVVPKRHINFPRNEYFVKKNKQGERVGYDWLKWIGHVCAVTI